MRNTLLLLLAATLPLAAKPMPAPTMEEALRSAAIVEAEYVSVVKPKGKVEYFGGVEAIYRVTRSFKGPLRTGEQITIGYAFHDGSACLAPPDFRFTPELMPPVGSRWILFLQGRPGSWGTYRGDYGRKRSTPQLREQVERR